MAQDRGRHNKELSPLDGEQAAGKLEPIATDPMVHDSVGGPPPGVYNQFNILAYSADFPPADELEKIEKLYPGATSQLFAMRERQLALVEGEAQHRRGLDTFVVNHNVKSSQAGTRYAFASVVLFWALAALALYLGYPTQAAAIVGVNLTGLVTVFVAGRLSQKSERIEKAKIQASLSGKPKNSKDG